MTETYDHSSAKEDERNDLLAGEEYDHSRAKEDRRMPTPDEIDAWFATMTPAEIETLRERLGLP